MAKSPSTLISTKLMEGVHCARDTDTRVRNSRAFNRYLMECWKNGQFKFEDLDLAEITHSFRKNSRFNDAYQAILADGSEFRDNRRQIAEAISLSQYGDFVNSCSRMGSYEFCASPDFAPVLSLFPRRFVGCENRDRYTMPALADFEPPCVTEDEPTQYFGIGDITKICDPEPDEKRFGMQLKRNMICIDPNGEFRSMIREQMAQVLRMHGLRQLIRQILNCSCGADVKDPCYDGIQYNPYLQCGPWCNLFYSNTDFNCACQHPAICAIENMNEDMRNPVTGNPMQCCDMLDVMVFSQKQRRYVSELLGPHLSKRMPGAECNECEVPVQSREGWGQLIYSKWVRKIFRECLCEEFVPLGATDAEIDQMLERTIIAGCFQQSLEWQVRWDTEFTERSGTQTSEYHRENIIYSVVVSEYTGAAWNNPWAVFKAYGLPDTLAGAAVTPPTACTDPHPMCAGELAGSAS